VRIAIGSDSNVVVDPFEEVRELETGARREGLTRHALLAEAGDLWGAVARDGLASLGIGDAGEVAVDLDHPRLRGVPDDDVMRALATCGAADIVAPVRRQISSGSTFEEQIAYSRAVVDGDWVHVSGTTGFDYATMTIEDDVVAQCRQCLANIADALAEAGCRFADVVRVRYLLPDRADFEPCWPLLREAFGDSRPAATMHECGLSDPRMRIEIEVTARRP
jgi:enamine deaminase RidA (YjgF/YER057c/UK114 family)